MMTLKRLLVGVAVVGLSSNGLFADTGKEETGAAVLTEAVEDSIDVEPAPRPKIGWARFNEDWSVLKERGNEKFFDPIKYIPFNEEGNVYLSLGGQVRQRVEVWENFAFTDSNDDAFLLSRY